MSELPRTLDTLVIYVFDNLETQKPKTFDFVRRAEPPNIGIFDDLGKWLPCGLLGHYGGNLHPTNGWADFFSGFVPMHFVGDQVGCVLITVVAHGC